MLALLQDIAALPTKVSVRERWRRPRKPSFAVGRPGEAARISFAGIPMGHEFTSLILALLQTGGHPPKAEASVIDRYSRHTRPFHFETFISLSCHNCPDVVQALNLMAVLNPGISHQMIDGALFQDEVEPRQIMGVPTVFLNGEQFGQGRMTLEEIIGKIDTGALQREADKVSAREALRRAHRRRRPGRRRGSHLRRPQGDSHRGGQRALRWTGARHPGDRELHLGQGNRWPEARRRAGAARQGVRRRYHESAARRGAAAGQAVGGLTELRLASGAKLRSKTVILATGARWREMNVPGEKEYRGHGVAYCPHCDGPLFKGKRVAVIGGGNSGVEAAIDLAGVVGHVTLLEFEASLRADAVLQKKLFSLANVKVITRR
jgi:alkyl hydroperoxide reductase subunit F